MELGNHEVNTIEDVLMDLRDLSVRYGVVCTHLAFDYVNYVSAGLRPGPAMDFIRYNLEMGDRYK